VSAVPRLAVPAGTVPPFREFKRHIWRYRDERGHSALCAPPEVFTLVLDDKDEADQAATLATYLSAGMGFADRVTISFRGQNVLITFRDISVLHAFLRILASHSSAPAQEIAAFCMALLGFRWT
jgi:hypothetical protein